MSESATPAAPRGSPSRGMIRDVAIVIGLTLVSIVATSYLELDEWLTRVRASGSCSRSTSCRSRSSCSTLGLMWFSTRRHRQTRLELAAREQAEARLARSARGESRARAAPPACRKRTSASISRASCTTSSANTSTRSSSMRCRFATPRTTKRSPRGPRAGSSQSADHVHAAVSDMIRRLRPVGPRRARACRGTRESASINGAARLPGVRFSLAFGGGLDGLGEQVTSRSSG